jgi:hypothetical protein
MFTSQVLEQGYQLDIGGDPDLSQYSVRRLVFLDIKYTGLVRRR